MTRIRDMAMIGDVGCRRGLTRRCRSRYPDGQMELEVVLISTIIILALVAMAGYVKRAVAGAYRSSANSIGEQYEPRHTTSPSPGFTTTIESDTLTKAELKKGQLIAGKKVDIMESTTTVQKDVTTRSGKETVDRLGTNIWER